MFVVKPIFHQQFKEGDEVELKDGQKGVVVSRIEYLKFGYTVEVGNEIRSFSDKALKLIKKTA